MKEALSAMIVAAAVSATAYGAANDYLVIDLSGGPNAERYPVATLFNVPLGGWTDEYKTTSLVLRKIPRGGFYMGSPAAELGRNADETQHPVMLTEDFYIGMFPVTQRQYQLVMGATPSQFAGDTRPVSNVSYDTIRGAAGDGADWPGDGNAVAAASFMGRIRAKAGLAFDLPTEAQWEYACRAGTTNALNSGENLSDAASCAEMGMVGRYSGNSGGGQHVAVGGYLPNSWGLYDMHGNVVEWCLDWYEGSYGSAIVSNPAGPESGAERVIRGGSYLYPASVCRSAARRSIPAANAYPDAGFRVCVPQPGYFDADPIFTPLASTVYEGFVIDGSNLMARGTMTLNVKVKTRKNKDGSVLTNVTFSAKVALQDASVSFTEKNWNGSLFQTPKGEKLSLNIVGNLFSAVLQGGKIGEMCEVYGARNAFADKKDPDVKAELERVTGLYNVALVAGAGVVTDTQGFLSLSVGVAGAVKYAGQLGDGSSVSGSARLLKWLNRDGWYAIGLHQPLYSKKGFVGGVLWLNPTARIIRAGWPVTWACDDPKRGGPFSFPMDVVGGYFSNGKDTRRPPSDGAALFAFIPAALPPPADNLAGPPGWVTNAYPSGVAAKFNGPKLAMAHKGVAPKPDKATGQYDYSLPNPSCATIAYTAKTGIFKGKFNLYFDGTDTSGKSQHKTVGASYTGVMIPYGDYGGLTGIGVATATLNKRKGWVAVGLQPD